ncbi:hypothetical protein B5F53_17910 [Blautia sp. An249]|uniref:nickel-dependent lactate racemase n=1 Tax=Blautia sp. An249 TaxID=1965603 RepID=UPI000B396675|nr:nickel-dependent lactate racemase [Blautia sp. An249]OUO75945.1 hypothetical protein B5F53_17910 [Blautia sp. An249]
MPETCKIPYGKGYISYVMKDPDRYQILEPGPSAQESSEEAILREALDHPIGTKKLHELTREKKKILIITNDNTRPMPCRITIPAILKSFYYPETYYDITILIANGMHREMTEEEKREQFGEELYSKYPIVNHKAGDKENLKNFGVLSTGNELWLNRLLTENEVIITEGFIEPHFFAGFSGGRKSILPGIAGESTIMRNHCPQNIRSPYACSANLEKNPVHLECLEAAERAGVDFILNVALDKKKKIIGAFAGDLRMAHLKGCRFVEEQMKIPAEKTDIVITSNNGYPLDRNLYQLVKGADMAAHITKDRGVIIIAAQCADGVGHRSFEELILSCATKEELYKKMSAPPIAADKWQVQILARILQKKEVILVSGGIDKEKAEKLFLHHAETVEEAVTLAEKILGREGTISIIPEGPVIIPVPQEKERHSR